MTSINHQVRLAARPSGLPRASDWEVTTEPAPTAGAGWPSAPDHHQRRGLAVQRRDGQLVAREHIVHGSVGDFPAALLMLFAGENTGKLILALDRG